MNIDEAKLAIEALKDEIDRYEALERSHIGFMTIAKREAVALEIRNYLYATLRAIRAANAAGSQFEVGQYLEEAWLELHQNGTTAFKPVWYTNINKDSRGDEIEDPVASQYRSEATRKMTARVHVLEKK